MIQNVMSCAPERAHAGGLEADREWPVYLSELLYQRTHGGLTGLEMADGSADVMLS